MSPFASMTSLVKKRMRPLRMEVPDHRAENGSNIRESQLDSSDGRM
jgi:hypothetical protein